MNDEQENEIKLKILFQGNGVSMNEIVKDINDLIKQEHDRVIGRLNCELDFAENDKEMAENPEDPKIRIQYLRHILTRI